MKGKLKSGVGLIGFAPVLINLSVGLLVFLVWGWQAALTAMSMTTFVFSVLNFIEFIHTRNGYELVVVFYLLLLSLIMRELPRFVEYGNEIRLQVLLIPFVVSYIATIYGVVNRKMKWRGREIFEMAAAPVGEAGDGYTARPFTCGKEEYSVHLLMNFAEFIRRKMIARVFYEAGQVVFVPVKMGDEYRMLFRLNADYERDSWIAFKYDGSVTVNISQKDYFDYIDAYSFERLCESLGNIFIEFLHQFQQGRGGEIIQRMNAMGISVFE
ncbi:MAG: hypothetical protein JW750_03420 [Anaerolineaceae bacterium]|nr:hypothetical protein [Anaerolineaceae bacterium]